MLKLGSQDRKVDAPKNPEELISLLSQIMAAAVNDEVDIDSAKLALNAATRIVDVWQADTRMKAIAISAQRTIGNTDGFGLIAMEREIIEPVITKTKIVHNVSGGT
jgi:hypothetical protein